MYRNAPQIRTAIVLLLTLALGCRAQQPAYIRGGDDYLSHYIGVATQIETPDLNEPRFNEIEGSVRPFSLANPKCTSIWELTLEDTIKLSLQNAKVIRSIGGQVQGPPTSLTSNPQAVATIYDPSITETDPRFGVDAGLSLFDAQVSTDMFWERNHEPRNISPVFESSIPTFLEQDSFNFQQAITKTNATGGSVTGTFATVYDKEPNNPENLYAASWTTSFQLEVRQPLLQGAGTEFNRIAGPGAIPGFNQGVVLARLNTDIALATFEGKVRNFVNDVETSYWELYFAYRNLDSSITFQNRTLGTWQKVYSKYQEGVEGGGVGNEAQAREQYFLARTSVQQNLNQLFQTEAKLRYMMGLASTDGRLIRPLDEPTTARIQFDWNQCNTEANCRSVELRQARWTVKQRELELIAAKNYLLPRLDAVARYKWLGLGPSLVDEQNDIGSIENTFSGEYSDWHLELQGQYTLGARKALAGIRNAEEAIARDRARLRETELEVSHQVAYALRDVESDLVLTETNYNHELSAVQEFNALTVTFQAGQTPIDVLLSAERSAFDAETSYYRALVNYTEAISEVHYRKGSLLEYNGVYLAEGPWPGKAYFDAQRRAQARSAARYLDYTISYPKVVSRGPMTQFPGDARDSSESGKAPPLPMLPSDKEPIAPAPAGQDNQQTQPPKSAPPQSIPRPSDRLTDAMNLPAGQSPQVIPAPGSDMQGPTLGTALGTGFAAGKPSSPDVSPIGYQQSHEAVKDLPTPETDLPASGR